MYRKLKIKYQGTRYPRIVNLRRGKKIAFLKERQVITLEEYDALLLLKLNNRLNPNRWEFTVLGMEVSSDSVNLQETEEGIMLSDEPDPNDTPEEEEVEEEESESTPEPEAEKEEEEVEEEPPKPKNKRSKAKRAINK